jgi:hypothetical protein
MFKGGHGIFALWLLFWDFTNLVNIGLFETIEITGQTLANNLIGLFDQYELRRKIIVYVKNGRSNLNIITIVLKSIMKCEGLNLDENFQRTCFGHVFLKACQ